MDSLSGLKTASSRNLICATAGKAELLRNSSYTDFRLSTLAPVEWKTGNADKPSGELNSTLSDSGTDRLCSKTYFHRGTGLWANEEELLNVNGECSVIDNFNNDSALPLGMELQNNRALFPALFDSQEKVNQARNRANNCCDTANYSNNQSPKLNRIDLNVHTTILPLIERAWEEHQEGEGE